LKGWQWLFLVEGFPAVILRLCWAAHSRPEEAKWLTDEEKQWLALRWSERVKTAAGPRADPGEPWNPRCGSSASSTLNTTVTYGIFLWLPKILGAVSGYKDLKLGILSGTTLIPAIFGMILITAHSDRTGERRWHTAVCAVIAMVGLVLTVLAGQATALVWICLAICHLGQRTVQAVFWSIPPVFLGGAAAAAGIAFINSIGNLGGQVGPTIMGWLYNEKTHNFNAGLLVLAGALLLEAVIVLLIRMPPKPVLKPA
jgi:ACS family tartrate transporter-like MFS transporter